MAFWFMLLLFVGFFVLTQLLRPKPEESLPGKPTFNFPTATEGRVVPLVWGTVKIDGPNVVWYGDTSQVAITQDPSGGGLLGFFGLFSGGGQVVGYKYFVGIQFALCRGEVDALLRIWVGDAELFSGTLGEGTTTIDAPNFYGGNDLGNGGIQGDFSFLLGTEVQAPNPYLSAFQQEGGDTPGYVGTCYGVFEGGYIGNSTSIKPWSFEVQRIPNGLGLSPATVNTFDANPANVLYEILTNTEWGLGLPAATIDLANFEDAGDTLESEGNGFSMVLDRSMEALELLRILEKQIDGLVIYDRSTGKWQINLVRGGYDIDLIPQLDETNIVEVSDFARGAWEDTTNHIKANFTDRARGYFETSALAQDMANVRIQAGQNITAEETYPGVKDATLANSLAWRDLRSLSYPLAKARLVVDRTVWDLNPGDVVAWTDSTLGFTQLPMRISKIDLGELQDGRITLDLVQDIFQFAAGSFSDPPATGWDPPEDSLAPFPAAEQLAFPAPYAFVVRDPAQPGIRSRLWAAGRNQGDGAAVFDITQRNAAGSPSGAFANDGTVNSFMLIGELVLDLERDGASPQTTVDIDPTPDSLATLLAAFSTVSPSQIGVSLAQLMYVGGEFIAAETGVSFSGDLRLGNVYRGLLDTTPQTHPAGTPVYMIFVGGGMSVTSLPVANNVEVRLLPRSATDQVASGSATTISFSMDRRDRRPYPPILPEINGSLYEPGPVDLDDLGAGLDDPHLEVSFIRRDWRTSDEVQGLTVDAASIQADFPAFNNTRYEIEVIEDPSGTPTSLYTTDLEDGGAPIEVLRRRVLRFTNGVLPTELGVRILAVHDFETDVDLEAQQTLDHDFSVEFNTISGHFNFTTLDENEISAVYTAPDTGTYTFNIGSNVLSSGIVEARINAGAFTTVISTGNVTGTLPGVTAADTIEIRHTQGGSNATETFLELVAPTAGPDAYAILVI